MFITYFLTLLIGFMSFMQKTLEFGQILAFIGEDFE